MQSSVTTAIDAANKHLARIREHFQSYIAAMVKAGERQHAFLEYQERHQQVSGEQHDDQRYRVTMSDMRCDRAIIKAENLAKMRAKRHRAVYAPDPPRDLTEQGIEPPGSHPLHSVERTH
jgi:hypothetical protein